MKTYVAVYFGALLVAMIATPIVAWIASARNLVDKPGVRKVHHEPIPRIGGVAIFLGTLTLIMAVLILNNTIGHAFWAIDGKMFALLAGASCMFLVGLVDDIYRLRARIKFIVQLAAALAVCAVGIRIESFVLTDWFTLKFGWFSWPLTILWIVGITNAVNLIDGLDGLAAGISAITCGVIMLFALFVGQTMMAVLMLAMLGSLTGFLLFNFHPAKIFMGDCGSLFLGFMLATSSVMCAEKSSTIVGLALPALALGIPIFDTLFSMLRRILERRSMFAPDRGHMHHRLAAMGLHQNQVTLLMYAVTALSAGLGMFMLVTRHAGTLVVFACVLLLLVLIFRLVGSVRLRETLAALHRNRAIAREASEQRHEFEDVELRFREAATFDQWWKVVEYAAGQMEFSRVALTLTNRDGTTRIQIWRCPSPELRPHETVSVTVPVRHRRPGGPLQAQLDVLVAKSLESVGRRIALFGRLLDEHSIGNLPATPAPDPCKDAAQESDRQQDRGSALASPTASPHTNDVGPADVEVSPR